MKRKRLYHKKEHWITKKQGGSDAYPAAIIFKMAEISIIAGQWDAAAKSYESILNIGRAWNIKSTEAESLFRLGEVHRIKSEYQKALSCFEESAQIYRALGNAGGIAKAIGAMGGVYGEQGEYQKAIDCFQKRKDWAESIGDKMELHTSWGNLGVIYAEQKMTDQALECYEKQRVIAEELGDLEGLSYVYGNSGNMHLYRGEYDKAVENYRRQSELATKIGDKRSLCAVTCNLGLLFKRQAQLEKALDYFKIANKAALEIGYMRVVSLSYGNMGGIYQNLGEWDQASILLRKHLEMSREMNDRQWTVTALANMSKMEAIRGNHAKAKDLITEAVYISKENSLNGLTHIVLNIMGEVLMDMGSYDEMGEAAAGALKISNDCGDKEQAELADMMILAAKMRQGNKTVTDEMKELARKSEYESVRVGAGMEMYRHTGAKEYLNLSEELSEMFYNKTRDVEYKIRFERLKNVPTSEHII